MFTLLFGKPKPQEKVFCRSHEPKVFSRFPHNHTRGEVAEAPAETVPPFQSDFPEDHADPVINPVAHLHSDAPIPLDLFRRALPQRFREIDAKVGK